MPDPFMAHRKQQEAAHWARADNAADPMNSLISVELNITELCNRLCPFCPRVDPKVYPNRKLMMNPTIADKVAVDLASFDYQGRISFSGFGEPLLHKGFTNLLKIIRVHLPNTPMETNTNGDFLSEQVIQTLFDAGLTNLYINMYDGPEQEPKFHTMCQGAGLDQSQYRLRPHWAGPDDGYGLELNNRSGMLQNVEIGISPLLFPLRNQCHYPFYKMLVDWDGKVLFCSNDWGREIVIGNVNETHIKDLWLSDQMLEIRTRLARGERSQSPCNKCSVKGTLHGRSSFDLLVKHYHLDQGDKSKAA